MQWRVAGRGREGKGSGSRRAFRYRDTAIPRFREGRQLVSSLWTRALLQRLLASFIIRSRIITRSVVRGVGGGWPHYPSPVCAAPFAPLRRPRRRRPLIAPLSAPADRCRSEEAKREGGREIIMNT
jgi:hypothetical protein